MKLSPKQCSKRCRLAFTLVEVLVSLTVLVILLLISAQVINTVQSTWTTSNARVSQFREARIAFDIITRNLTQATLNTYIDYDNSYLTSSSGGTGPASTLPTTYLRKSDLRFLTGNAAQLLQQGNGDDISPGHAVFFQAPLGVAQDPNYVGLDRLLCGRGYFVQYTSDEFFRPGALPAGLPHYRYRLMEFSPPAEKNMIYDYTGEAVREANSSNRWFEEAGIGPAANNGNETPTNRSSTRPIADNIVALVIAPQIEAENAQANDRNAYTTVFEYDSATRNGQGNKQGNQHRLPSLVKVLLVAIDERSADRLSQMGDPATPPLGMDIKTALNQGPQNLNTTMEAVAKALQTRNVNYRIFSSTVALRGAKVGG